MASNTSLFTLTIEPLTKTHLLQTARWARFLAILGLVVLVLGLIVTLMGATVFTTFFGIRTGNENLGSTNLLSPLRIGAIVGSLVFSIIAFFPLIFLLRFANDLRRALLSNDQKRLNISFANLKVYFRYLGILAIIFLVLYGAIITIGILGLTGNIR